MYCRTVSTSWEDRLARELAHSFKFELEEAEKRVLAGRLLPAPSVVALNKHLKGDSLSDADKEAIFDLSAKLKERGVDFGTPKVVYRGIGIDKRLPLSFPTAFHWSAKSLESWTASPKVALMFAAKENMGTSRRPPISVVMRMKIKPDDIVLNLTSEFFNFMKNSLEGRRTTRLSNVTRLHCEVIVNRTRESFTGSDVLTVGAEPYLPKHLETIWKARGLPDLSEGRPVMGKIWFAVQNDEMIQIEPDVSGQNAVRCGDDTVNSVLSKLDLSVTKQGEVT